MRRQGNVNAAIADTSSTTNGVATLGIVADDPPTQREVQTIADQHDELINALRRQEIVLRAGVFG